MLNIDDLTAFIGWCTVINICFLSLTSLVIFTFKDAVASIHSSMTGIEQSALMPLYFQYLGQYKILIMMLNLVPYFALKLMIPA